jgi:hypothetical protein
MRISCQWTGIARKHSVVVDDASGLVAVGSSVSAAERASLARGAESATNGWKFEAARTGVSSNEDTVGRSRPAVENIGWVAGWFGGRVAAGGRKSRGDGKNSPDFGRRAEPADI